MAVPTYNHDLTDWIIDSYVTAWSELTNADMVVDHTKVISANVIT